MNDIVITAADLSLRKRIRKKSTGQKSKKWFDGNLYQMRKFLIKMGFYMQLIQMILIFGALILNLGKCMQNPVNKKKKLYKSEMIVKLQQLHDNDPKAYWKLLEDLKSDDSVRAEPQISSDEWTDHFSSLNEIKHKYMTRTDEIWNLLEQNENVKEFNELDFKIKPDEQHAAMIS